MYHVNEVNGVWFTYNGKTGQLRRWYPGTNTWLRIGTSINSSGYVQVTVPLPDRHERCAHRLIWRIVTGRWPKGEIDHKNRRKRDNRWVNLRDIDSATNKRKRKLKSNTSGFIGVCFDKLLKKWVARIRHNGVNKNLGGYNTPEEAHKVRTKFILDNGLD